MCASHDKEVILSVPKKDKSVENAGVAFVKEPMKEMSSLKKKTVIYDEQVPTNKVKD